VEVLNSLWVERYRPKELKDLVLPDEYRSNFEKHIKDQEIPHLLLTGPPGSGKTCVALIFCSKYGVLNNKRDNLLEINGSAKETRSISYVQDVIEPFVKIPAAGKDKHRIVFIDEADYLTDQSAHSLRSIIEKYSDNARFIFTCNYVSKIPDAVQSRLSGGMYAFKQMPIEFVQSYCKSILSAEKIEHSDPDITFVINSLYPDIRKVVNTLQKFSSSGSLKVNKNASLSTEKVILSNVVEIINFIQKGEDHKINASISNVVGSINEFDIDYRSLYTQLFFMDQVPIPAKIIVNKYTNSHNDCLVPSMNFFAMIYEIVQVLQKYKKLSGK